MNSSPRSILSLEDQESSSLVSTPASPFSIMEHLDSDADSEYESQSDQDREDDELAERQTVRRPIVARKLTPIPKPEPFPNKPAPDWKTMRWGLTGVFCISLTVTGLLCMALPLLAIKIFSTWLIATSIAGFVRGIQNYCCKRNVVTPTSLSSRPSIGNPSLNSLRATRARNMARRKSSVSTSEPMRTFSAPLHEPLPAPLQRYDYDSDDDEALRNRQSRVGTSPQHR